MVGGSAPMERVVPKPRNDDEDDLMDVQLPSGMIFVEDGGDEGEILQTRKPKPMALQKPDGSASVDDRAILNCWDSTVASHERASAVDPATGEALSHQPNEFQWHAKDSSPPPNDETHILANWQPKSLPLPPWAVDPFRASTS